MEALGDGSGKHKRMVTWIKTLFASGASPEIADASGNTPFHKLGAILKNLAPFKNGFSSPPRISRTDAEAIAQALKMGGVSLSAVNETGASGLDAIRPYIPVWTAQQGAQDLRRALKRPAPAAVQRPRPRM
jgi:hypothetical protein